MKNIIKKFAVAVAIVGLAGSASAVPITGEIGFSGVVQTDTGNAATATTVTGWGGASVAGVLVGSPIVNAASGDFTPFTATPASFLTPWTFATVPANALWSVGAGAYVFDLLTSTVVYTATSVTVTGTGTINSTIIGKDPTSGSWSFTTQNPPIGTIGTPTAVFTFSASSAIAGVPDGGMTVVMLGFACLGIEGMRRKLRAS